MAVTPYSVTPIFSRDPSFGAVELKFGTTRGREFEALKQFIISVQAAYNHQRQTQEQLSPEKLLGGVFTILDGELD